MMRQSWANTHCQQSIGTFWLVEDHLIFDIGPISDAERCGDVLTFPQTQTSIWTVLQRNKGVRPGVGYQQYPRGRVVFDLKTHVFKIYADCCILERRAVLKQIREKMNLPRRRTFVSPDDNYRCTRCSELMLNAS